jgi:hypothetical protein
MLVLELSLEPLIEALQMLCRNRGEVNGIVIRSLEYPQ